MARQAISADGGGRSQCCGKSNCYRHCGCSSFVEVVPPERVSFRHLEPIHRFLMTMDFEEEAGKTRLTWSMLFDSPEEAGRVKRLVAEANEQNFDRLAEELAVTGERS